MARPRKDQRRSAEYDDAIGPRIRERRIMLGLTQQQLAEMIGVTYQQEHKYERGINRVSAGQLYVIARALNAPVSYFYDDLASPHSPPDEHARVRLNIARHLTEITDLKKLDVVSRLAQALA